MILILIMEDELLLLGILIAFGALIVYCYKHCFSPNITRRQERGDEDRIYNEYGSRQAQAGLSPRRVIADDGGGPSEVDEKYRIKVCACNLLNS